MYVEYANGEREYYDLDSDPYELTNIYPELSPDRVDALHTRLARMESCHGTASCRQAARKLAVALPLEAVDACVVLPEPVAEAAVGDARPS